MGPIPPLRLPAAGLHVRPAAGDVRGELRRGPVEPVPDRRGRLPEARLAADLTPANVRLISISAQLSAEPGQLPKSKTKTSRDLVLEGIVRGDRLTLESTLAGYLMELNNSPMFKQPTISKKSFERYDDQEALTFTARLKLG